MGPALGFASGLFLGIILMTVVRRLIGPKHSGGTITVMSATCVSTGGMVRVKCTAVPDPGCTIEGVMAKVYDDPLTVPGATPEGMLQIGTGSFDFMLPCSSVNSDLVAVWPVFKGSGPPLSMQFGPCTTSSTPPPTTMPPTTTTSTTTTSTTTTMRPMPIGGPA